MEIPRITKLIIQQVAANTVKVAGKHYRQSPLVQGGLEVPCEIIVRMSGSIVNQTLLQRCKTLLRELYTEPKEEAVMGEFLSDPGANTISFSIHSRQKNNRKNQDLQQSGQKI